MLFSSITFLFGFLPIFLLVYFIAPEKCKNLMIALASLVFYAWGEPKMVMIMILCIFITYFGTLLIAKFQHPLWLIVTIAANLSFLIYFKYTNFFVDNINLLFSSNIVLKRIILPIGISFYTFQTLSYCIGVYRGDTKVQKNIITLFAYITMFPQLIAGPIVRYQDVEKYLEKKDISFENIANGIKRFIYGLTKKVFLANQLAELMEIIKAAAMQDSMGEAAVRAGGEPQISTAFYITYLFVNAMYVYFDFSGYSDMAIGLGRIMGIHFMENFNFPFISKSITEFWRRWHISLGQWFRDYVYIPLGGNRRGIKRQLFNLGIVWLLTGIWHGADWNFALWGIYFGVFIVIEKLFLLKHLEKHPAVAHIYTVMIAFLGFIIFSHTSMSEIGQYIGGVFGIGGDLQFVTEYSLYYMKSFAVIIVIGLIMSFRIHLFWYDMVKARVRIPEGLPYIGSLILFVIDVAYLIDASFNPFLYFRF